MPEGVAIVIHDASVVACHEHPRKVTSSSEPGPPSGPKLVCDAVTEYVHVPAAWLTVNVLSLTVIVPDRAAFESFAAAVKPTDPFCVPLCPKLTVSHAGALLTADQLHPAADVTLNEPFPPAATTEALDDPSVTLHV